MLAMLVLYLNIFQKERLNSFPSPWWDVLPALLLSVEICLAQTSPEDWVAFV